LCPYECDDHGKFPATDEVAEGSDDHYDRLLCEYERECCEIFPIHVEDAHGGYNDDNNVLSIEYEHEYNGIAPSHVEVAGGNDDNNYGLSCGYKHQYCGITPSSVEAAGACNGLSSKLGHKCCESSTAPNKVTRIEDKFSYGKEAMDKHECTRILHYHVRWYLCSADTVYAARHVSAILVWKYNLPCNKWYSPACTGWLLAASCKVSCESCLMEEKNPKGDTSLALCGWLCHAM